ncbi:ribonuclease HII [Aureimonas pseudogalii]|uniref:Ribonuclease HII n=1 Tax=Aureimonas pseudogalii TaxID=1744844 RepID=A0A7W6H2U4_9HYPH|nr:ribonuclease HII [Aureimonas pseudogalii]MBB3996452.1 ribonuclease HII [Aureimonas pseudogalii]
MRESRRNMARRSSDSPAPSRPPARPAAAGPVARAKTPAKPGPDFALETALLGTGLHFVVGIDEAGRGPLAGPVVASAVLLDPAAIPDGLDDSKALSAADRERLFAEILRTATVSIASASAGEIDRINIRQATLAAMRRALAGLPDRPCHALIDGRDVPSLLGCAATAVIGGDARSLSVAAASIVAKVTRDRMMKRLCQAFPVYGFGQHMGYGTPFHLEALARHGPCRHHRTSFSPVRQHPLPFAS